MVGVRGWGWLVGVFWGIFNAEVRRGEGRKGGGCVVEVVVAEEAVPVHGGELEPEVMA